LVGVNYESVIELKALHTEWCRNAVPPGMTTIVAQLITMTPNSLAERALSMRRRVACLM
jgi:hypothetical protein